MTNKYVIKSKNINTNTYKVLPKVMSDSKAIPTIEKESIIVRNILLGDKYYIYTKGNYKLVEVIDNHLAIGSNDLPLF